MNYKNIKKGDIVYVETPSHGYVSALVTDIKKKCNKIINVKILYKDDFIKHHYGGDNIIYSENNINEIKQGDRKSYWKHHNQKEFTDNIYEKFKKYKLSFDNKKNNKKNNKKKKSVTFEPTSVQKFVRDYIGYDSPYRGLLLYHGLGTGKTCGAIGISESLKDKFYNCIIYNSRFITR